MFIRNARLNDAVGQEVRNLIHSLNQGNYKRVIGRPHPLYSAQCGDDISILLQLIMRFPAVPVGRAHSAKLQSFNVSVLCTFNATLTSSLQTCLAVRQVFGCSAPFVENRIKVKLRYSLPGYRLEYRNVIFQHSFSTNPN